MRPGSGTDICTDTLTVTHTYTVCIHNTYVCTCIYMQMCLQTYNLNPAPVTECKSNRQDFHTAGMALWHKPRRSVKRCVYSDLPKLQIKSAGLARLAGSMFCNNMLILSRLMFNRKLLQRLTLSLILNLSLSLDIHVHILANPG